MIQQISKLQMAKRPFPNFYSAKILQSGGLFNPKSYFGFKFEKQNSLTTVNALIIIYL